MEDWSVQSEPERGVVFPAPADPGGGFINFTMPEPHDAALRKIRKALAEQGVKISVELDIAARMKREVGAGVAPCVVLYADDPALLLEAVVFHRGAGLVIPQPVVVSGNGGVTQISIHNPEPARLARLPLSVREPLAQLHARIVRALEGIASRQNAHLAAGT